MDENTDSLRPTTVDDPHVHIMEDKGDLFLGYVEHANVVPISDEELARRYKQTWPGQLGCAVAGFSLLFLLVSGLIFWLAIFAGWLD